MPKLNRRSETAEQRRTQAIAAVITLVKQARDGTGLKEAVIHNVPVIAKVTSPGVVEMEMTGTKRPRMVKFSNLQCDAIRSRAHEAVATIIEADRSAQREASKPARATKRALARRRVLETV